MFCKQNWRFASSLQQKLREGRIQKQTQPNSHISFDGVFQISGDAIEIQTHVTTWSRQFSTNLRKDLLQGTSAHDV